MASIRSGIGENMVKMPLYKGTPTARDYEDDYTKGWNDAMDFIFPEAKEKREKERVRKNISIIKIKVGMRKYGR